MADPFERAFAEQHKVSCDAFLRAHDGADVIGVEVGGQLAGGAFFLRGAAHIGILPQYRSRWTFAMKAMLERGFRLHGSPLLARVGTYNSAAQAFLERIGGVRRGVTDWYVDYDLFHERMTHVLSH
jgi:hypothetical protein